MLVVLYCILFHDEDDIVSSYDERYDWLFSFRVGFYCKASLWALV